MIIRPLTLRDLPELGRIHESQYQDDFPFPDFTDHYLGSFAVVDSDNKIVCGGGVRTFAESVLITDQTRSPRVRRAALLQVLEVSSGICRMTHHNLLVAYPKDENWVKVLRKYGFVDQVGIPLQKDIK